MAKFDTLVLKTRFKLTSDQSDMFERIRLSSLINLFIQAAIESSAKYGFGFDVLTERNMTWMLGRISVEIYKYVKWNDEVEVETWPKTVDGLLYIRDFIAKNSEGEIIAKGTTGWLAIDLTKKRISTIDFLDESFRIPDKVALDYMPVKLRAQKPDEFYKVKATYYDIDLNRHVTAVRYLDWMMDTFDIDFHENNFPTEVHVNYSNEIKAGEEVKLGRLKISDKEYYFTAMNETTGKEAFKAIIKF